MQIDAMFAHVASLYVHYVQPATVRSPAHNMY